MDLTTRRAVSVSAVLAIALFALSLWLFYPGLVTYDSILQFGEAQSGHFTTVHPPLMAATWRLLLPLGGGALPMLVLDQLFYWASFFLLALYCIRARHRRWAPLVILAGLWPLLWSFSGVIWKDVVLASAWGLSCALMLMAAEDRGRPARSWFAWMVSAALLLFGTAMRHNAAPAAVILAIALATSLPARQGLRMTVVGFLSLAAIIAVPLSSRLLHAKDSRPVENLISWDLTGVSYFSGHDFRGVPLGGPAPRLDCYSPRLFDACPLVPFRSTDEAMVRWRGAIAAEPVAYLKHRALVFSMLMRFGCVGCHPYIWEPGGDASAPPELGYRPNAARTGLGYIVRAIGRTPLGRPYTWLAAAILLSVMLWRRRSTPNWQLLALISLSGAVYGLVYAVAAVTDEFRYIYWLIYSVVLVTTAFLATSQRRFGDLARWVIIPLIALALADLTVQLVSPTDRIAPSMTTNY